MAIGSFEPAGGDRDLPAAGSEPPVVRLRSLLPVAVAVARRPRLWPTAVRAALDLAPAGWWRHSPFLPLPDPGWLRFRLTTAYGGDGSGPIVGRDLVDWLEWRRDWDHAAV